MSGAGYSSVPTATAVAVPPPITVEVVAPSTLAEGYTFDAIYEGTTFTVTVPSGGVKEGQRLKVPFVPPASTGADESTPALYSPFDNAPHGLWRDGLCDCLRYGPLHPSFLNAWCCPLILMGQVLTRMKLNWLGVPAPESEWTNTFRNVFVIFLVSLIVNIFIAPDPKFTVNEVGEIVRIDTPAIWRVIVTHVINIAVLVYTFVTLMKTRRAVREKYEIPERNCKGCEDLCCAVCCGCCTVSQVARQTADYYERRAVCCSKTGLPATHSVMVV